MVENARTRINEVLAIAPEGLTREADLGSSLSFSAISQDIKLLRDFLASVTDSVLGDQSDGYLRDFSNSCGQVLQAMHRIRDFKVANLANPQNERDQRQQEFQNQSAHLVSNFRPLYLESLLKRTDPTQISSVISSAIAASLAPYMPKLAELERLGGELQEQKGLAAETIEKLQAAAASTGVARYRGIFDEESKTHDKNAGPWLRATVAVALITAAIAVGLSAIGLAPEWLGITPVNALQLSLTKVILVGLGISAAVWCGSNYRALRHLSVVDKHRANALATYEIFAAATSDPQERGLILTQSAQAIFGHVATGYLGKDAGHVESQPQILQIARDAGRAAAGYDKP
jgi:hypothetical protein